MQRTNAVAGLMSLLFLGANTSYGQAPAKQEFEVASVRASSPRVAGERPVFGSRSGGPGTSDPARITYSNEALNLIVADAFDVYWNQVSGPDWVGTERYDIVANVPEGATKEQAGQMLQNLLAERFHLSFHMQTKVIQGYELTMAEGGSKLKETVIAPQRDASIEQNKDNFPVPPLPPGEHRGVRRQAGHTFARFADASVSEFAAFLSTIPGPVSMVMLSPGESRGAPTPVLDKTGLTGRYDFTFDYDGGAFFGKDGWPRILSSVRSALNKQLGLRMVDAKVPVDVLVIDHVDKTPTEN